MKALSYKYCFLKYVHTPILNESINIGVLLYCEQNNELYFNFSKNLSRIKNIYRNVPEKTIKELLKFIEGRIYYLNNNFDDFYSHEMSYFDDFIDRYILNIDSTIVQFSKSQEEFVYNIEYDQLIKHFEMNYFIEDLKLISYNSREPELLKKFYSKFSNVKLKKSLFYTDYHLKNSSGVDFKFDYAWQNGTLNLVKPISFDLKDEKNITEKAYKNFGQFSDLKSTAEKNEIRFDLLIAKPRTNKLLKSYDHALGLLEKIDNVKLIEENQIEDYSNYALSNVLEK